MLFDIPVNYISDCVVYFPWFLLLFLAAGVFSLSLGVYMVEAMTAWRRKIGGRVVYDYSDGASTSREA